MKQSKYNYLIEKEAVLYGFNGISCNYFKTTVSNRRNIENILSFPELYKNKYPSFYNTLINGNFLMEDTVNELDVIRNSYKKAVNNKSAMLIILPTFECNFRCWYCVQNHNSKVMSLDTIEKVKKHITYIIEHDDLQNIHIEWFGGEPFLYYKEVIKPISLHAKHLCEQKGIEFVNTATTNGYLITETIAKELESLNFQFFQITLDGDREHHNKTRIAPHDSSFDTILKNVNLICQNAIKTNIMIRINYDDKNLNTEEIFNQICNSILPEHKKNIELLFRKIWQVTTVENADEKIKYLIKKLKEAGFRYSAGNDLVLNSRPCYVSQKGMKLITPVGTVEKCSAKADFETKPLGRLQDNGTIKWINDRPIFDMFSRPLFENKMCLSCKYLPLCMGPCPRDIDSESVNINKSYCKSRSNDLKFTDSILLWCAEN